MMLRDVIHFYRVKDLAKVRHFYEGVLGFSLYKDQTKCLIYDANYGKIGFCVHFPAKTSNQSCLTFVFDGQQDLEDIRRRLLEHGYEPEPIEANDDFKIVHFFVRDGNGLNVECQVFR
jgi:catechol 2,3-dioxygenase-like lactoylglutathione lyase family enzyme